MAKEGRLHKATYARDKKKGGYLIRIVGPTPAVFAGRTVPVTTLDGGEHDEKLVKLVWSGAATTAEYGDKIGDPIALYTFEAKPKAEQAELPF